MGQRIIQVDAFAAAPFKGNPAAICVLEREAGAGWMQRVANEMNLSETAYVVPRGDGFGLRWFTPTVEVDLCGHATVAAAHVLWEEGVVPAEQECRFHTRSGLLTASMGPSGWIEVQFARETSVACDVPAGVDAALGTRAQSAAFSVRLNYLVVELASEDAVRSTSPDFSALGRLPYGGVIVTAAARPGAGYEIVSRFFAPRMGVNEDPATGSAHCVLGPYWAPKLGRSQFDAFQASARGADIRVSVDNDSVILAGQAVTVMRGEWV